MKLILCLTGGLCCLALTGCQSSSNAHAHHYDAGTAYYTDSQGNPERIVRTGPYDATTTYANGLYPAPTPVVQESTQPASTATSTIQPASTTTYTSQTATTTGSSSDWVNVPMGRTVITPVTKPAVTTTTTFTQVQTQPQHAEPQGGVAPTYSTGAGSSDPGANNPKNKSGLPYSAYRGTDEHWYDQTEWDHRR